MGKSRSVSFVVVYLMHEYKYSYEKAYDLILSRRNIIYPNRGFIKQLKEFKGI